MPAGLLRKLLVLGVLALHGAVAVPGHGLHALPGCDHGTVPADDGTDCPICHFQGLDLAVVGPEAPALTPPRPTHPRPSPLGIAAADRVARARPRAPPRFAS